MSSGKPDPESQECNNGNCSFHAVRLTGKKISSCSESSQAMVYGCTTLAQIPKSHQCRGSIPVHQAGINSSLTVLRSRMCYKFLNRSPLSFTKVDSSKLIVHYNEYLARRCTQKL
ncbi:hypothetical protein TNCV_3163651 [Trichonephila clavipes]|nr:hypothetical protein TNCV_3163651 [Trichonephila clavipes]